MRRLFVIAIAITALGAGAWYVGAQITRNALSGWLDDRRAEGWLADARSISVGGIPTRFETELVDLVLADPSTGVAWRSARVILEQAVWRPDRMRVQWPASQTLSSPEQNIEIEAELAVASLDLQPASRFALDRADLTFQNLRASSSEDWGWTLASGEAAMELTAPETHSYQWNADAFELVPSASVRAVLDPAGILPEVIDSFTLDATLDFDRQWDRHALERARPQPEAIDLREFEAVWGDVRFRASGALEISDSGEAEGAITLRAENWQSMLDLAVNSGLLPETLRPSASSMLELLARMNGRPEDIDATLDFRRGRVFLGPIPIGPAPSFTLR